MITKLILNFMGTILTILINIVNGILPENSLNGNLGEIITTILSITQQALNFMYFIFGETLAIVVPITIALLAFKYTIAPVVQLIRAFFINSTE